MKNIVLMFFVIITLFTSASAETPTTKVNISKNYEEKQGKVDTNLPYQGFKLFFQDSGPMVINNEKMNITQAFSYAKVFIEFIKNGWYESFNLSTSRRNIILIDDGSMISIQYNKKKKEWFVYWSHSSPNRKNLRQFFLKQEKLS